MIPAQAGKRGRDQTGKGAGTHSQGRPEEAAPVQVPLITETFNHLDVIFKTTATTTTTAACPF